MKNVLLEALLPFLILIAILWYSATRDQIIHINTSLGDIEVELYPSKAPITVANFLSYVDEHFYDGTIFHRVIDGFMIQAGGHNPDLTEKPGKPPIRNECVNGLKNTVGTIGMARLPDFDSATSQWYINVADNAHSDGQYCVFGKVRRGMGTVNRIKAVKTGTRNAPDANGQTRTLSDVPLEPVIINYITRK